MSEKLILSYLMQENRPDDWDNMFFATATLWSRKSHDSETQCGCVLVKNKTIIATGYNGFIRGIDDFMLPNTRPAKYPFMIHAEANARARVGAWHTGADQCVPPHLVVFRVESSHLLNEGICQVLPRRS